MESTYTHHQVCPNCNKHNQVSIPKGCTIKEFMKKVECFYCGCDQDNRLRSILADRVLIF